MRGEGAIIPATARRTRGSGGREGTRGGVALADFVAPQIVLGLVGFGKKSRA